MTKFGAGPKILNALYIIATYKKPQELEIQLKLAVQRHNHLTDNLIKQSIEIRDLNTEKLEISDEKLGLISENKVLHEKNFELIIERNGLERILEEAEERENGLKHQIRGLNEEIGGLQGKVKLLENNLMEIDFELDDLLEERDGWGVRAEAWVWQKMPKIAFFSGFLGS